MRALWPFGQHETSAESTAAIAAAHRSHDQAVRDHTRASATRAEADVWAAHIRDHNSANRYDAWLRDVMHGRGNR